MNEEVKYLVLIVALSAAFVSVASSVQANHFSICSPGCNTTVVWWNDTVNVTGVGTNLASVTARVDGVTACATTTSSTGNWNCSFIAPQGIGDYNLSVAVGSTVDDFVLKVRPSFGQKPVGSASRFVLETPWAIQEPSGKIRSLVVRLTVSRGPPS